MHNQPLSILSGDLNLDGSEDGCGRVDINLATRHEDFWFDDGSIVLSVESTLFRVHRTVLCKHSEVFANMFSFPQPEGELTIDGCLIVTLHDKTKDFIDLLQALYDPLTFFDALRPHTSVTHLISSLSGILRLSTKYFFHNLRRKSIDLLKEKFPSTLSEFTSIATQHPQSLSLYSSPARMRIINLARETNVPELLPFAFYLCARLDSKFIQEGTSSDALSPGDKATCLSGRERLLDAQNTISYRSLLDFHPAPSCKRSPPCPSLLPLNQHKQTWDNRFFSKPITFDPFKYWGVCTACPQCIDHARSEHLEGLKKAWDLLPEMFDLGNWEDIRRVQQSC